MIGENGEPATVGGNGSSAGKLPTLEEYGTDLTKLAEEVSLNTFLFLMLSPMEV